MLTITEPELADVGGEESQEKDGREKKNVKKRVVMVMARQHPGESPASYVVQGEGEKVKHQ